MTLIQIEKRVKVLEQAVDHLAHRTRAGRFANDAIFDKILGQTVGLAFSMNVRKGSNRKAARLMVAGSKRF